MYKSKLKENSQKLFIIFLFSFSASHFNECFDNSQGIEMASFIYRVGIFIKQFILNLLIQEITKNS